METKLIPTTPVHWAAYLASFTTVAAIATRMPIAICLVVTTATLTLWAWLARDTRKKINAQDLPSLPPNTHPVQTARAAVGERLQENVQQHLIPATESLQQMAGVISGGTRLLQDSFTELATKSAQQVALLNTLLTQIKGTDGEGMLKGLMEADHCISTSIDSSSLLAKDIQKDVSNAVIAMQFEDSATQIAHYVQAQLQALDSILNIVQQELHNDTDIIECLNRIDSQLQTHLTSKVHQAVTATSMREGEIDLF